MTSKIRYRNGSEETFTDIERVKEDEDNHQLKLYRFDGSARTQLSSTLTAYLTRGTQHYEKPNLLP